jgi:hypothetical protein
MGIVTSVATPARADGDVAATLILLAAGVVITDVVFAGYDISVAGKSELPSPGWALAETIFTAPQTVAGLAVVASLHADHHQEAAINVAVLVPTIGVSILSTHGIWATATTNVHPGVLAGTSAAVGADAALTTAILVDTRHGRLSTRPIGITTMLFTAPQVAAASYVAATSAVSARGGWIALSAWSGALFLHGLVSTIGGRGGDDYGPVEAPPPPPPRPYPSPSYSPYPQPVNAPPRPQPRYDNRPPLMVPESLRVGPMMVTDGVASAMGVGVSGVLF